MKKLLYILFVGLLICSCTSSTKKFNVENIISTDKEYMSKTYGDDYRWFETCILLNDYLDSEDCNGKVAGISNIFQVVIPKDNAFDTQVILASHTKDNNSVEVKHAFWVEDFPITEDSIIKFKDAYFKVMATNLPKPHSKQVVLRKQIGPKPCNPQYIFGNIQSQVYVDAITGVVTDINPAFGDTISLGSRW